MKDDALKLVRHRLGSIDISDAEGKEMSGTDRAAYCAALHAVFPRLEADIRKLLYQQTLWSVKESANWDQVIWGRGVIEGMAMLHELWKQASQEHVENSTKDEPAEKHSPFGEV